MSGSDKYPAIHKSLLRRGTNQNASNVPTFMMCPINRAPKGHPLYDTIVFVIFCPKHQNIAMCQTIDLSLKFLPFIYLSKKVSYSVAIEDGLCLILSDYDSELLVKYKTEVPFNTHIYAIYETYYPNTDKPVIKTMCWARLHSDNPGFECCRNTSRIHWFNEDEEGECKSIQIYWGHSISTWCLTMKSKINTLQTEHFTTKLPGLYLAKNYYENGRIVTSEDLILKALRVTKKQIDLLCNDFYDQCFPGTIWYFRTFAEYLSKYGIHETDAKMKRLFNSYTGVKSVKPYCTWKYLTFENLLLGLAYIDKDCPHNEYRLIFVFNYYDSNRKGVLSEEDFREMVTDIHENKGQEEIDRIVTDGMTGNESLERMNWSEFYKRSKTPQLLNANRLEKCDHNLIKNIYKDLKTRTTRPLDSLKRLLKLNLN